MLENDYPKLAEELKARANQFYEKLENGFWSLKRPEGEQPANMPVADALRKIERFFEQYYDEGEIRAISDYLQELGITKCEHLSSGTKSEIFRIEPTEAFPVQSVIRIGTTLSSDRRAASKAVLQPFRSSDREERDLDGVKVEILPRVVPLNDVGSISSATEFEAPAQANIEEGFKRWSAASEDNLALLPGGFICYLDPEHVQPQRKKDEIEQVVNLGAAREHFVYNNVLQSKLFGTPRIREISIGVGGVER